MPSRFAISPMLRFCAARALISSALARAVGLRPLYLPSAFALAMPSRCRSSIISRSNSATPPITLSMSLPVGVLQVDDAERNVLRLEATDDLPHVRDAAGQPVELRDDERVTRTGKLHGLL